MKTCSLKIVRLFSPNSVGREKKEREKINFQRNKSYYTRIPKRICKSVKKIEEREKIFQCFCRIRGKANNFEIYVE